MRTNRILERGRRRSESRMTDTLRGTYTDPAAEPVRDPVTKRETRPTQTVYDGPGRLKFGGARADAADDLGQPVAIQEAVLELPVAGTGRIPVGAVFEVTASERDPGNVGRRFRVSGITAETEVTARRLQVQTYS